MDEQTGNDPPSITIRLKTIDGIGWKWWSHVESIVRVLSSAAVPIVLAIVGSRVQARLTNEAVKPEYVRIAISILQEPDSKTQLADLKPWAAELLNQNSPTKLPAALLEKLKTGDAVLPAIRTGTDWMVSGSITASPGTIRRGETARISWNSFNATRVSITPSVGIVPPSGSVMVTPMETTTYKLTLRNAAGGSGEGTATVTVENE